MWSPRMKDNQTFLKFKIFLGLNSTTQNSLSFINKKQKWEMGEEGKKIQC
jgi:hypothetical protein